MLSDAMISMIKHAMESGEPGHQIVPMSGVGMANQVLPVSYSKEYKVKSRYKEFININPEPEKSTAPMNCACGYAGKEEGDFIETDFGLTYEKPDEQSDIDPGWMNNTPTSTHTDLGPMFICPQCGVARFRKAGLVQYVLDKGSV